jgi:hypothetical protein
VRRINPMGNSNDQSHLARPPHQAVKSSSSHPTQSKRSLAFKRWAHDRCLEQCHKVSSYTNSFCCIRCHGSGHWERHCRFRSPSPLLHAHSSVQHQLSWADVAAIHLSNNLYSPRPTVSKVRSSPHGHYNMSPQQVNSSV